jgi:UDP-N-acetylglucosamine diphosphorylase/glucosamine-1-phosphate N-acetyltransferase
MQYILCNPDVKDILYPFSQLRSFAEIRIGIWTIRERYELFIKEVSVYNERDITEENCVFINGSAIPDENMIGIVRDLKVNEAVDYQNELVAVCVSGKAFNGFAISQYDSLNVKASINYLKMLRSPFDIVRFNQLLLAEDIRQLDLPNGSPHLSHNNTIIGSEKIIAEDGVKVSGAFLNTESGPIYLGKNVQIMEGACIRGPIAILDDTVVKMGATLYGATTIGQQCVVGGEIKNSVFFDYSNKAHHGYIGDSVIGSWCNMGAGTSCSNVKNNAGDIFLWNPMLRKPVHAGSKCGVMMGDHTRTAINTSLNSGTVTGICSNIVKHGFSPKYIADFTWDVDTGEIYREEKLLEDVHNWMKMKGEKLDEKNKNLLLQLYKERKTHTP